MYKLQRMTSMSFLSESQIFAQVSRKNEKKKSLFPNAASVTNGFTSFSKIYQDSFNLYQRPWHYLISI